MKRKVLLILADGFRPDALSACGHPFADKMLRLGSYSLKTRAVYPSVTLPCHMSLFHSVSPDRHGILTNTYVPQVRPVNGLCEQLDAAGKTCAFFYNWEELRDLSRPSSLLHSFFASGSKYGYEKANELVTQNALQAIRESAPDFAFVYYGLTDDAGHRYGWMGEEYLKACTETIDQVEELWKAFSQEYTVIFTSDHGGHGRSHGSLEESDMLIPLILIGQDFEPGLLKGKSSIMDVAPTITKLLGVSSAAEWEGRSLL